MVDFDLKRSHSLTSVVGKSNYSVDPSKSFKAWGQKEYDETPKQKGQKISMDFKYVAICAFTTSIAFTNNYLL